MAGGIFMERSVGRDLSQEKETTMDLPGKGGASTKSRAAGENRSEGQKEGRVLPLRMGRVSGVL